MKRIPVPQRRAALIQAALRVIARDGVAAATTRAIAAEAGMSLASLHYVFASRDELISYVVGEQAHAALTTLRPGADLVSTIRDALHAFLGVVAGDPQRELAMFELTHYALRTPGLAGAAKQQYDGYHLAAEQVVTAVAELTGHRWQRPTDEMARILITLTDGLTLRYLVDRDEQAATPVIDFAAHALAALATPTDSTHPTTPTPTAPPSTATNTAPPSTAGRAGKPASSTGEQGEKPASSAGGRAGKPTPTAGGRRQKPASSTGGRTGKSASSAGEWAGKPTPTAGGRRQKPAVGDSGRGEKAALSISGLSEKAASGQGEKAASGTGGRSEEAGRAKGMAREVRPEGKARQVVGEGR